MGIHGGSHQRRRTEETPNLFLLYSNQDTVFIQNEDQHLTFLLEKLFISRRDGLVLIVSY
ncbi:Hypothetical protein FKW44_013201 [Caligus rogercresseyi]|uniref:Uncharacterized protein n=1 Tax=Caligus rogercresseyi TaxID=217165 RepID=A0A7T8KA44_CALRO|nr:Hypothetical protein FKW44_013201 [Caligus rogercresseyi]